MREPPRNFAICPSCGTEFGYDDAKRSPVDLRHSWMLDGAPWFSVATPPPPGWNAWQQLAQAGHLYFGVHPGQQPTARGEDRIVTSEMVVQFS
jgi:hypothetical protein